MAKRLKSVFTDNMNKCIFTDYEDPEGTAYPRIERHHIFGGNPYRSRSEKYGFVVPLRCDLHPNGTRADPRYASLIDNYLKEMAQDYFEKNYGTREEFRTIFGRSYL